jgi:hypothetical protein
MMPELKILLGMLLISSSLTYLWWMKFRVWKLRQQLFAVRDRLWDAMQSIDQLEHPAHRKVREGINDWIRLVPSLSVWMILQLLVEDPDRITLEDGPPQVAKAKHDATQRIVSYLLLETFSGWLVMAYMTCGLFLVEWPRRRAKQLLGLWVGDLFGSSVLHHAGEEVAREQRPLVNV